MKRNLILIVGLVAFCSLFISIAAIGQQTQQTTAPFTSLTFKITPIKDTFLPMEPIIFDVALSNNTEYSILANPDITFNSLSIDLVVTNEQGTTIKIPNIETKRANKTPSQNQLIPPGKAFTSREVFYNLHPIFQTAGIYKIKGTFYSIKKEQQIQSEPVTITIVEPSAGAERSAYQLLKPLNKRGWLFAGDTSTDEKVGKLEEVVAQFPETRYADYSAYILGRKYQFHGEKVKAKQMFQRLLFKTDFPFLDNVKKLLKELERTDEQEQQ